MSVINSDSVRMGASATLTEVPVPGATGTILGDFTSGDGAGEAAAFDGNTDKTVAASARTANSATGFIGKDWGSGNDKLISQAVFHGPNNSGVCETDTSTTFALQGSATGAWGGEEVELDNSGSVDKSANNSEVTLTYSGATSYRYHRVYCTGGSGSEKWCCEQLVFMEMV
jgi:hypothetical protein